MKIFISSWRIAVIVLVSTFLISVGPPRAVADSCGEEYACNEALIKFSSQASASDIETILAQHGAEAIRYFNNTGIVHVSLPPGGDTLSKIEEISDTLKVISAAPNEVVTVETLPNDTYITLQWGMSQANGVDIGMDEVWASYTNAASVIVAVIDTGVDYTHPDLADNMWVNSGEVAGNSIDDDGNGYVDDIHGYDLYNNDGDPIDDHYHGTHVAGTIGAMGNNAAGVAGVAWTAKIMALKFLSSSGSGYTSDAIEAINYAVANGATVLNNSWGGGGYSSSLLSSINSADTAGAIFVAAAGNSGVDADTSPMYPAAYTSGNIISVASITSSDALSYFSNYGLTSVDLAAPGSSILSTFPTWYYSGSDDYAYLSGTSMATPHVSGAAALLWAAYPTLTHRQVINFLMLGVTDKSYLASTTVSGGLLNLYNSIVLAGADANNAPVANAGSDKTGIVGDGVALVGSGTDEDGDTLSFSWTLSTKPTASVSSLYNSSTSTPVLVPDTEGTYIASLVVSDPYTSSVADSATVTVSGGTIVAPDLVVVAKNSSDQDLGDGTSASTGETVTIDASDTADDAQFYDDLSYTFTLVTKPSGSTVDISSSDSITTMSTTTTTGIVELVPDLAGTYTIQVTADDLRNESTSDISFTATGAPVSTAAPGGCTLQGSGKWLPRDLAVAIMWMSLLTLPWVLGKRFAHQRQRPHRQKRHVPGPSR